MIWDMHSLIWLERDICWQSSTKNWNLGARLPAQIKPNNNLGVVLPMLVKLYQELELRYKYIEVLCMNPIS